MSSVLLNVALPLFMAMLIVLVIHPKLVSIAKRYSVVDCPNNRRLNKEPIPVLGGVGVYIGAFITIIACFFISDLELPYVVLCAATLMMLTGVIDDIYEISARWKFLLQIIAMTLLIFVGDMKLDNFHGLWGITTIPDWAAISITYITGVGIINAINLIDGVDGLSSGYGIITSSVCGVMFILCGNSFYAITALALVGALIPFFVFNTSGKKNKMFMGDGGSLLLGLMFTIFIILFVQGDGCVSMKGNVSFVLALFAIPVFDTLRVMFTRLFKKRSPFSPDKTHMHHHLINMGCSHIMTTSIILIVNILLIALWYVTEKIDFISVNTQFYLVVGFGVLFNNGICEYSKYICKCRTNK